MSSKVRSGASRYAPFALVLVIAVLLGSGLYTGIIPNALNGPSSTGNQQRVSTTSALTAAQISAISTEQATPIENLALGPNPSTLVVQLTDPPTVPTGTTSLNLTYSAINLVVAVPASKDGQVTLQTVAVTPQGGSATLDLLRLQNVSQTIAAANLPNGTTIYSLGFTVTGVSIAVDGNVSAVALATGASTLQVTLARSSHLYGTNAFLVELDPTVVDTPTGYEMIPSAVGILKTQSAASGSREDQVGSKQQVSSTDKEDLNNAKGNVTATITALAVSGNVTTLSVLINNTGDGPVNLESLGLAGNFTAVGQTQACTPTVATETTTSSHTSTTYGSSAASSRLAFTNITLANATSAYLYGRGEGGYGVSDGRVLFSLVFTGQFPDTHFSLALSVNGTSKIIGDYTTNSTGVGKVVASTELGNGSFALGLTILDDSTFGQPTPVLASDPATFTVLAEGSSTTTSTSTTSRTSSVTTTHTEPETMFHYQLVQVLPTSASGENASGYAGVGVSGHSVSIGWNVKGALPGEQLQMIMQVNGSGGEANSFPLVPVIVSDQGSAGSHATVSLDQGTYSIGLVVVDANATIPNTPVLTSIPASAQVTIEGTTTTSSVSTTTSVNSTSTTSSDTNSTVVALDSSDNGENGSHCEHVSGLILVPVMAASQDGASTTATTSTSASATSSSTVSTSTSTTTTETCSQGKLALVQDGQKPHEGAGGNVLAAGQCVELTFIGRITFGHSVTIVPSTEAGQTFVLGVLGTGESVMMRCVLSVTASSCTEITRP